MTDYIIFPLLGLVVGFAIFVFSHGAWERRKSQIEGIAAQEVAAYLIDRQYQDFIAVHGREWKWAAESDTGFHTVTTPWPKPPWMGTKYEAFYEDTYG